MNAWHTFTNGQAPSEQNLVCLDPLNTPMHDQSGLLPNICLAQSNSVVQLFQAARPGQAPLLLQFQHAEIAVYIATSGGSQPCAVMMQKAQSKRHRASGMNGHVPNGSTRSPKRSLSADSRHLESREPDAGQGHDQAEAKADECRRREDFTGQATLEGAHLKTHYTRDSFLCPSGWLSCCTLSSCGMLRMRRATICPLSYS